MYVIFGNHYEIPKFFKPKKIEGNSSYEITEELRYSEQEYKEITKNQPINFEVLIIHTFGREKEKIKSDFKTGHQTII